MKFLFELMLSILMLTNGSTGESITREDIQAYLTLHQLKYADVKIVNDRSALLVSVKGEHARASILTKSSKNTLVLRPNEYVWKEDEEGVSVEQLGGYLCIAIHDKALSHKMDFVNIIYTDDNMVERKDRYYFNGKQALIIPIPLQKEHLVVAVYGNDGFIHDMIKHVPQAWK